LVANKSFCGRKYSFELNVNNKKVAVDNASILQTRPGLNVLTLKIFFAEKFGDQIGDFDSNGGGRSGKLTHIYLGYMDKSRLCFGRFEGVSG
jgi:hypothetical protein